MKKFLATILSVILLLTTIPMAYAEESNTYKVGDIIQFGSYPQSEVKDEALIAELNALAPEWEEWTSYEYYSKSNVFPYDAIEKGNWMRYTDVSYNDSKYRGVMFTQYRPWYTDLDSSETTTEQIYHGYYINTVYWFKFEAIEWCVLDPNNGLVVSETLLDAQAYNNEIYSKNDGYYNDPNFNNYANDYETSSIRQWLNNEFYNTAFNEMEMNKIIISSLNNDGYGDFDSNLTNDKIFLLSRNEAINSDYGFSNVSEDQDFRRIAAGSDYARCQGLYRYNSWILRTSGDYSQNCCFVSPFGAVFSHREVCSTEAGIRPALRLKEISKIPQHKHIYSSTVTTPTCTTQGYTTYICDCGDSYISDYVNALGHKDNNSDYKCDNGCGFEFEKPAPEEPSKDCSCNCHKGGIMGFFWKIINFFNKLFKSNQICSCGANHW